MLKEIKEYLVYAKWLLSDTKEYIQYLYWEYILSQLLYIQYKYVKYHFLLIERYPDKNNKKKYHEKILAIYKSTCDNSLQKEREILKEIKYVEKKGNKVYRILVEDAINYKLYKK